MTINVAELLRKHAAGTPRVRKSKRQPDPLSDQMRSKMVHVNGYTVADHWRKRPSR